jgi:hypothetical protein
MKEPPCDTFIEGEFYEKDKLAIYQISVTIFHVTGSSSAGGQRDRRKRNKSRGRYRTAY